MKEADIQQWVKRKLEAAFPGKIYIFKVPQGPYGSRRGIPDLVAGVKGLFVAVEVKTETGKLTKLQEHEIKKINDVDSLAFTIYGRDQDAIDTIIRVINSV